MNKRIWLSVLAGLVLLSWQDILLWGVIFEGDELYQYAGIYHRGWFVMLWAWMIGGFLWLWPDWRSAALHAAMLYTLFFGGVPDVLYYWLQGRAIPAVLPWLDGHRYVLFSPVTNANLIASSIIWIMFWLAVMSCVEHVTASVTSGAQYIKYWFVHPNSGTGN